MSEPLSELTKAYSEFGPLVRDYAARRIGSLHDADEVLQETFLAVAKNLTGFLTAASRKAWLLGIAKNVVRNRIRAGIVRQTQPLEHDPEAPSSEAVDPRVEDMRRAIARLPDTQREVLELRLSHGCSYEEIAAALEIPIGTVRSRIHAAIASLKEWAHGTRELRIASAR